MADVTGRRAADASGRRVAGGSEGDRRGQLFLTTALAMAVLFVGVALLFNAAIYTENLGTRNAGVAPAGATDYRASVSDATAETIRGVNRHNHTSEAALRANLSAELGNWSRAAGTHAAYRGRATNATLVGTRNGTRIVQDDETRNFTNRTGESGWEIVGSTARVRAFRMNVSRDDLADDVTDAYRVNVTDADGDTWNVSLRRVGAPAETEVVVDGPSGSTACAAGDAAHVPVDLTAGTVNGSACSALDFWGDAAGDLSIRYANADQVRGTYELVVREPSSSVDDDDFYDEAASSSPYATPAIYRATVAYGYESADVYYRGTVRVAPGEPR